ncbi:hypothetical protein OS493_035422 [Desmophyllum pertusum]|uniref:Uncharacterized protein n=1 Tax=Desmophyllum pertusum TaxID=174260 RepID=A0A9X0D078_9CNID|nr:hypothetical protein OS493_035422 [Desmophyllum pertusum]
MWLLPLCVKSQCCRNETLTLLTVKHLFTKFTSDGLYCCLHTESEPETIRLYLAVNKYTLERWAKQELKDPPPNDLNDREPFEQRFSVDQGNEVRQLIRLFSHLVPKHGTRVRFSLGTNVNQPVNLVPRSHSV